MQESITDKRIVEYYFSTNSVGVALLNKYTNLNISIPTQAVTHESDPYNKVKDLRNEIKKQATIGGFYNAKIMVFNSNGIIKGKGQKYRIGDYISIEFWKESKSNDKDVEIVKMKGKLSAIEFSGQNDFEDIGGFLSWTKSNTKKSLYLIDIVWSEKSYKSEKN